MGTSLTFPTIFAVVILATTGLFQSQALAGEKSCIPGDVKPAKFRAGKTGFQDKDFLMTEGETGPEVKIGKSRIFMNPKKNKDTADKSSDKMDTKQEWCIQDPELARETNPKGNPNEPLCGAELFGSDPGYGKEGFFSEKGKTKEVTIRDEGGSPIAKMSARQYIDRSTGEMKVQLVMSGTGSGSGEDSRINKLVFDGNIQKTGQAVKTKMRLESQNMNDDKINGVVEAEMSGNLKEGSGNSSDPMDQYRLSGCKSEKQAKGQLREKDNVGPEGWVDLSGSHITLRGQEKYGVDVYKKVDDTGNPSYMASNVGRGLN